jgi:uncharacterized protein (DUF58 family)
MPYTIDNNRIPNYPNLELLARSVVEGFIVGLHKSPFHGFSVEFSEHRLYNAGEPTRHIDWKLYGRTDRMYVKRYEEETNLRCQVVIDISSSMFFPERNILNIDNPNKVTFSVYAAACIMQLLRKQRDALGLRLFSDKVNLHTQAKSNSVHHKFLLSKMEELLTPISKEDKRGSFVTDSLHFIAENIHKRSLVVLFSDMFDAGSNFDLTFDALQHLRYNKHELILFHVTDKSKELDFDFENRPYRFIDLESGDEIKLQPSEVRKTYTETIGNFHQKLKLKCAQYKIDFIEADINKGFEQVLLPYLLKRERLG